MTLDEVEAYVDSARQLELMALDLAHREVGDKAAIHALIVAADGDVRPMRRAHRHIEFALAEQWPARLGLIRAFDFLSAARRELEIRRHEKAELVLLDSAATSGVDRPLAASQQLYDVVDQASMESFPASDAPSFWAGTSDQATLRPGPLSIPEASY